MKKLIILLAAACLLATPAKADPAHQDPRGYFTDIGMFGGWHFCKNGVCALIERVFRTQGEVRDVKLLLDRIKPTDGSDISMSSLLRAFGVQ